MSYILLGSSCLDAVNKSDEVFSQFDGQKLSLRQASDPLGRVKKLILKKTSTARSQNCQALLSGQIFCKIKTNDQGT